MKKKILLISLAVFAVSLSAFVVSQNANSEDSLLTANIEALAQNSEDGSTSSTQEENNGTLIKGYTVSNISVPDGWSVSVSWMWGFFPTVSFEYSSRIIPCCCKSSDGCYCDKALEDADCAKYKHR